MARKGHQDSRAILELERRPKEWAHVFDLYDEIAERRRITPTEGELPLDWADVRNWREVMDRNPTRDEVRLIFRIDDAYFAAKLNGLGKLLGG